MTDSGRKPYTKPRLVVYGALEELTLTNWRNRPMSDGYFFLKT